LRLQHFGQDDHVRLYSRAGFLKDLVDAGFDVTEWRVDKFDPALIRRNAIAGDSVLYVVNRRD
jgi:hypothetical protein